jgi:hypothetical protein
MLYQVCILLYIETFWTEITCYFVTWYAVVFSLPHCLFVCITRCIIYIYIYTMLFFLGGRRGTRTPKHSVNLKGERKIFKMLEFLLSQLQTYYGYLCDLLSFMQRVLAIWLYCRFLQYSHIEKCTFSVFPLSLMLYLSPSYLYLYNAYSSTFQTVIYDTNFQKHWLKAGHMMAQWLRHCAKNRKVRGIDSRWRHWH